MVAWVADQDVWVADPGGQEGGQEEGEGAVQGEDLGGVQGAGGQDP